MARDTDGAKATIVENDVLSWWAVRLGVIKGIFPREE
jgi:hypothetical protein